MDKLTAERKLNQNRVPDIDFSIQVHGEAAVRLFHTFQKREQSFPEKGALTVLVLSAEIRAHAYRSMLL